MILTIFLRDHASSFDNRTTGARLRNIIEDAHRKYTMHPVEVDFTDVSAISSSFADEFFGKLAVKMGGINRFRRWIIIMNANEACSAIVERMVQHRISHNKYVREVDQFEFGSDDEFQ